MEFHNPVEVLNLRDCRERMVNDISNYNSILIICSESALKRFKQDHILKSFFKLKNISIEHNFSSNPALDEILEISQKYISQNFDTIIGMGGGSSMDVAKILSATIPALKLGHNINDLLNNPCLIDFVQVIDCFHLPTTAGTGSEVTPFATIWDYGQNIKKSLSHKSLFAKKVYIDSFLIESTPLNILQSTGLDALNQAFESLWNINSNEISKLYAIQAIELSLLSLPFINQVNVNSTISNMLCSSSLNAGIAISHTRTAICHSISYPLTLHFNIPHGYACAFTMLEVYDFNKDAIKKDIDNIESKLSLNIRKSIEEILTLFKVEDIFNEYMGDKKSVLCLEKEMITKGRFENNIIPCPKADLVKIINNSCNRYLN
jgi:alcohol dehydrogenase